MSIERINQNSQMFAATRANNTKTMSVPFEGQPQNKSKKLKTAALVGLGALGAVGVALLAIRKGKAKEVITSLDDFRAGGNRFVKGKAVKANGKDFTGTINKINKDGTNVSLKYENGNLVSSTKVGAEKPLPSKSRKLYVRDENGKIKTIKNQDFCLIDKVDGMSADFMTRETIDIPAKQRLVKKQQLLKAIGNKPVLDSPIANGYQVFKHRQDELAEVFGHKDVKDKLKSYEDFVYAIDVDKEIANGKFTKEGKEFFKSNMKRIGLSENTTWDELLDALIKDKRSLINQKNAAVNELPKGATKTVKGGVLTNHIPLTSVVKNPISGKSVKEIQNL